MTLRIVAFTVFAVVAALEMLNASSGPALRISFAVLAIASAAVVLYNLLQQRRDI